MDRESTHPLENFFGFVRMEAGDINTPEQMFNMITHTAIVKEANRVLESVQDVRRRANLAGAQISDDLPNSTMYDIALAIATDPARIAMICLKAVHAEEGSLDPDDQIIFLQFREYLTLLQTAANDSRLRTEISQRFIYGSGPRIVRLLASHEAKLIE
jgi:hypothetical protein